MPKGTKTERKSRSSKRRRATKFASKLSPSPKLSMRDNWINFFEFENSGGGGGTWPEVLQATQNSNGTYDFQIWHPPTSEGDEPNYIEWSSDEPVFAAEILEQLTEGLVDGWRASYTGGASRHSTVSSTLPSVANSASASSKLSNTPRRSGASSGSPAELPTKRA
jgi:hypothetical protein